MAAERQDVAERQDADFAESTVGNGSSRGNGSRGAATREQRGTTVRPIRGLAAKQAWTGRYCGGNTTGAAKFTL